MSRRDASSAKALAGQRKYRRKWLTFLRMLRYGVNNFSRNAWLTVAATAVMTITLLIIFMTFVAQNVLSDTATEIGKRIDRSIYLKPETTEAQAKQIMDKIAKLDNVEQVTFKSSAQARADYAKENKQNCRSAKGCHRYHCQLDAVRAKSRYRCEHYFCQYLIAYYL